MSACSKLNAGHASGLFRIEDDCTSTHDFTTSSTSVASQTLEDSKEVEKRFYIIHKNA